MDIYTRLILGLRPANELLCNDVSHWLVASLESALYSRIWELLDINEETWYMV